MQGSLAPPAAQGSPESPAAQGSPESPAAQGSPESPAALGSPESPAAQTPGASAPEADAAAGGLRLTALNAGTVEVAWQAAPQAITVQIFCEGRMVDEVPAAAGSSYVVHELWQSTTYELAVRQIDSSGATVGEAEGEVSTPSWQGSFPRLYASTSFINQEVSASPALAPSSAAMVSKSIVPYVGNANFADSDQWGSPIVYADSGSDAYSIECTEYLYRCTEALAPQRIPASASPTSGSDHRLTVIEPGGEELDMWDAAHAGGAWSAGMRYVTSSEGEAANCTSGEPSCYGANAAHFANAAGIVRPEEIAQGRIEHALVITTPYTRANYIACPATGTDGPEEDPDAIPIGAHVQLDPSIDVSQLGLSRWQEVIATALQQYGAYVIDTGGSLAVRAEANIGRGYDAWAKAGVPADGPSLSKLPWDRLRVLSMTRCERS